MINYVFRTRLKLWLAWLLVSCLIGCKNDTPVPPLAESSALIVAVRVSPITYSPDSDEHLIPFEHDLLIRLAEHLKKQLEVIPLRTSHEVINHVAQKKAHLGAGWFPVVNHPGIAASVGFHSDSLVLVQQDPSIALEDFQDLSGKTIHVPTGSLAADKLHAKREKSFPSLTVIERPDGSGVGLLRSVSDHEIEFSAAPKALVEIAQNYFPDMLTSLAITDQEEIVWLGSSDATDDVLKPVNDFLTELKKNGQLNRIKDAHFSFRRRLTQADTAQFIEKINSLLPDFHGLFKQAQIRSNIDWRLIAALAYQESKWDPNATSPTGVRGMMMLTEDTADRLRVSNRLNARESILAGADYLAILRDELPANIDEPDRTWLALAAYNLGMGHLKGARSLAQGKKLNSDNWYDMKKMLPLLSQPEYYSRLISGRARGGEAVILVENVRAYYDILSRHVSPYTALPDTADQMIAPAVKGPGLKAPTNRTQTTAGITSAPRM